MKKKIDINISGWNCGRELRLQHSLLLLVTCCSHKQNNDKREECGLATTEQTKERSVDWHCLAARPKPTRRKNQKEKKREERSETHRKKKKKEEEEEGFET